MCVFLGGWGLQPLKHAREGNVASGLWIFELPDSKKSVKRNVMNAVCSSRKAIWETKAGTGFSTKAMDHSTRQNMFFRRLLLANAPGVPYLHL